MKFHIKDKSINNFQSNFSLIPSKTQNTKQDGTGYPASFSEGGGERQRACTKQQIEHKYKRHLKYNNDQCCGCGSGGDESAVSC